MHDTALSQLETENELRRSGAACSECAALSQNQLVPHNTPLCCSYSFSQRRFWSGASVQQRPRAARPVISG